MMDRCHRKVYDLTWLDLAGVAKVPAFLPLLLTSNDEYMSI
jgi:hypothetical protein